MYTKNISVLQNCCIRRKFAVCHIKNEVKCKKIVRVHDPCYQNTTSKVRLTVPLTSCSIIWNMIVYIRVYDPLIVGDSRGVQLSNSDSLTRSYNITHPITHSSRTQYHQAVTTHEGASIRHTVYYHSVLLFNLHCIVIRRPSPSYEFRNWVFTSGIELVMMRQLWGVRSDQWPVGYYILHFFLSSLLSIQ